MRERSGIAPIPLISFWKLQINQITQLNLGCVPIAA